MVMSRPVHLVPVVHGLGGSAASGVAVGLAFASGAWGWVAWVALVPLLLVIRQASTGGALACGFLSGLTAAWATFSWLAEVPAFGLPQFIVLGAYVALYCAVWAVAVKVLARRGCPLVLTAPALWVALDFVRSHAGFLALPIGTLGQSQQANTDVLQVAALGGEGAVTFLVVMANVALAQWLQQRAWRTALAAGGVVGIAHAGGAILLATLPEAAPITVAAVQPAIGIEERQSAAGREAVWLRLVNLSREAATSRPVLIAWPETAVGDPRHDAALAARLAALAHELRIPLIVGSSEAEKFMATGPEGTMAVRAGDRYNAAYLVEAGAPLGAPYRKRRLMPFGEYTPLKDSVAWPHWLVPAIVEGQAGDAARGFRVAAGSSAGPVDAGLRVGVLICWENLFADLSRDAVRDGVGVLVQLTNDAWFGHTRAATQHNAASVLRAVENGVPLVLASNAGPSLVIDAQGRIVTRTARPFDVGVAVAAVPLGRGATIFNRFGDWFAAVCALVALSTLLPHVLRADDRGRPFGIPASSKESS